MAVNADMPGEFGATLSCCDSSHNGLKWKFHGGALIPVFCGLRNAWRENGLCHPSPSCILAWSEHALHCSPQQVLLGCNPSPFIKGQACCTGVMRGPWPKPLHRGPTENCLLACHVCIHSQSFFSLGCAGNRPASISWKSWGCNG